MWVRLPLSSAYDGSTGLLADGIAPAGRWKDVPQRWTCPDRAAATAGFILIDD
ncbi:MAG: rubredoxin [Burkholderiales bacterium]|nr:rubredoxin [Burkholderiales bacterium]